MAATKNQKGRRYIFRGKVSSALFRLLTIPLQQLGIIQKLFDPGIQRFLVIFGDQAEFVVAQQLVHAADLGGTHGGTHNQLFGRSGREALGQARADY